MGPAPHVDVAPEVDLELARAAWPQTPEIEHERALYLASPERMLQILATRPAAPERSMLVGHNPGMHQLARNIRDIERAMGDGMKRIYASELPALKKLRRVPGFNGMQPVAA